MTDPMADKEAKPGPRAPRPRAEARSHARLAAVQALYAVSISEDDPETLIADWPQRPHADPDDETGEDADPAASQPIDRVFMAEVVRRAHAERTELSGHLGRALVNDGGIERIEPLLRAILTAAAYEMVARFDVPARVVIDEYVRLTRGFYDGGEPSLVNAVLDRLARAVRPMEMAGLARETGTKAGS